jgi:hypothetical protein
MWISLKFGEEFRLKSLGDEERSTVWPCFKTIIETVGPDHRKLQEQKGCGDWLPSFAGVRQLAMSVQAPLTAGWAWRLGLDRELWIEKSGSCDLDQHVASA